LFADGNNLNQFGGVGVEIDHVARLLGRLRAAAHGHAHVRLRERRGVVGAVPGHGHQFALGLLAPDQIHLVLGTSLGEKVINAGLAGNGGGGERVVARDHDSADAHGAELLKALAHTSLHNVFEVDDAQRVTVLGHHQRSASTARNPVNRLPHLSRHTVAMLLEVLHDGVDSTFADKASIEIDAGHARGRAKGDELGVLVGEITATEPIAFLGQHHDRAALGSFVRE